MLKFFGATRNPAGSVGTPSTLWTTFPHQTWLVGAAPIVDATKNALPLTREISLRIQQMLPGEEATQILQTRSPCVGSSQLVIPAPKSFSKTVVFLKTPCTSGSPLV